MSPRWALSGFRFVSLKIIIGRVHSSSHPSQMNRSRGEILRERQTAEHELRTLEGESMLSAQRSEMMARDAAGEARSQVMRVAPLRQPLLGMEAMEKVVDESIEDMDECFLVGEVIKIKNPEVRNFSPEKFIKFLAVIVIFISQALTALSVTLGPRVFSAIVRTAAAGTRYINAMNRMRLSGEIKLLPLDRLAKPWERYPGRLVPQNTIPLMDLVDYPPDMEVAVRYTEETHFSPLVSISL